MKKLLFLIIVFFAISYVTMGQLPMGPTPAANQPSDVFISVSTLNTDLVYKVSGRDGRLYQVYIGTKLGSTDDLKSVRDANHPAYATFGTDNLFEPAIRMTHNDGNPSLELKYITHNFEKTDANITITNILLKDPEYPVEVTLHIKSYSAEDVIEQWVEIVQKESKPLTIFNYASSMLHFDAHKYWLTQFHGDWAEEMKMEENELTSGIKVLDSKLGTRAHKLSGSFFLSFTER